MAVVEARAPELEARPRGVRAVRLGEEGGIVLALDT